MSDKTHIEAKQLFELLKEKGVEFLHHANTVKTSLSFIEKKALLSRSYIETNELVQTPQYTDDKDKKLNIWDSIFLDGWDLHKPFGINFYGPVLFVMDSKL